MAPGDPMSDVVAEESHLDPSVVLAAAIDRLRADGHEDLAAAVERVDAYVRELAVAHTEIALASDRVLERGSSLLGGADTVLPVPPGRQPG